MFETSLLGTSSPRKSLTLGYLIEIVILGVVVLFPLIHMEALPALVSRTPIAPPLPPAPSPRRPAVRTLARLPRQELMAAPVTIPNRIVQLNERPPAAIEAPAVGIPGSVPSGDGRGLPNGMGGGFPPPPPTQKPAVRRVPVGGAVEAAKLIFGPRPEYPSIARMARVQGTVRLAAIINPEGTIGKLQVLSGQSLLIQTTLDAVSRWRYQPTLLDGEPVEVSTEIDVNFVLGE